MAMEQFHFDPTVIAKIGGQGADIAGATARGYQLSDIVDKQQIGRMQLNAEKQSQTDLQTLRSLASKSDLSTPEGQNQFSAKAIAVSPELGMKLQKQFGDVQTGSLERDKAQLDILEKQHSAFGSALEPLFAQGQEMMRRGASPQEVDAALIGPASEALKTLGGTMLPNGKPAMDQNQIAQMAAHLGQGNIFQSIQGAVGQNKEVRDFLKSQQSGGKTFQMVGPQGAGVYQRNPTTGQPEYLGGIPQTAAQQTAATSGIDDDTASMMAGQLMQGTPQREVLSGLSPRDRAKVNNELTSQMKEAGLSPAMIVAKKLQLRGTAKAIDRAGGQAGGIAIAINELAEFAPLALAASEAVDRSKFRPFNELLQMGERNISDPNLARLYVNTQAVLNAYNQVAARGGTGNVDAQQHNREMLGSAQSKEVYKTALDAIQQEGKAAERAAQSAMNPGIYNQALGQQSPTPPPSGSPSTPPGAAASGAPTTNQKGWAIYTDKNGSRAYVSPDGKSFEEIP